MEIKSDLTRLNVPYTYLVCADGAMILDSTDYCLLKINLEKEIVEKVVNILKENGLRLDDSQVKEVREYLYAVANIALKAMNNNEENKVGDSYGN